MSIQEQQYIRGFNHGYMLAKHLPDLVGKLVQHLKATTSEYLSGFFSGKDEWELEHGREQLNELDSIRNRSADKARDIDKE